MRKDQDLKSRVSRSVTTQEMGIIQNEQGWTDGTLNDLMMDFILESFQRREDFLGYLRAVQLAEQIN